MSACQCGNQMRPNANRAEIAECGHCDRLCMGSDDCQMCARLNKASGIGPRTR